MILASIVVIVTLIAIFYENDIERMSFEGHLFEKRVNGNFLYINSDKNNYLVDENEDGIPEHHYTRAMNHTSELNDVTSIDVYQEDIYLFKRVHNEFYK